MFSSFRLPARGSVWEKTEPSSLCIGAEIAPKPSTVTIRHSICLIGADAVPWKGKNSNKWTIRERIKARDASIPGTLEELQKEVRGIV